jgi:hypothetical protein
VLTVSKDVFGVLLLLVAGVGLILGRACVAGLGAFAVGAFKFVLM